MSANVASLIPVTLTGLNEGNKSGTGPAIYMLPLMRPRWAHDTPPAAATRPDGVGGSFIRLWLEDTFKYLNYPAPSYILNNFNSNHLLYV